MTTSYTPLARSLAFVLSLAVLHPQGLLAQVNVSTQGGGGTWTGGAITSASSFLDGANFSILNTADPTKVLQFSLAGITTGTTRTLTIPNASGTLVLPTLTQTWTVNQQYNAGIFMGSDGSELAFHSGSGDYSLSFFTQHTPDTLYLSVGPVSNAMWFGEFADRGTEAQNGPCGTATCTNPHLNIRSAATTPAIYGSISAAALYASQAKVLTESSATSVARIPVAAGAGTGGNIQFTVFAADAVDQQARTGRASFAITNKAGTETCTITDETDASVIAASTGTLTYTLTCDTTPTNAVDLQINAVSSLTQTTLRADFRVFLYGPGEVLPQ